MTGTLVFSCGLNGKSWYSIGYCKSKIPDPRDANKLMFLKDFTETFSFSFFSMRLNWSLLLRFVTPGVSPCPTLTLDPVHRHHPGYSVTSVGCPQELSLYKHYCLLSLCCTQTESWNLQHKLIIITMMRRRDEESSLRRSLVTRRIDRKPPISSCPPTSVTATT